MATYAVLIHPGHNRVYYKESLRLSQCELSIAAAYLHTEASDIRIQTIAGVQYCTFQTMQKLDNHDINLLSRLSFLYALFALHETDGNISLVPVQTSEYNYIDEKITGVLKYKGKTNERFTKMVVNIAWLHCSCRGVPRLLDPMTGKGTTLHTAMTFGLNAYGVEQRKQSVSDGVAFLKRYLQDERLKHTTTKRTINGKNRKVIGKGTLFEYANCKESFAAKQTKTVEIVEGDAAFANDYFINGFFDMIAADLPYGVQHANHQGKSIARSPQQLLDQCLPSWITVLKSGGVMVLAWNANTFSKNKMTEQISAHGLTPVHTDVSFSHYVDVSIQRDIVIAMKS